MDGSRPANRTNYHSHCSFCDGKAPMEEFIKEAIRQGFSAYGISSHAPLPFATAWTLDRNRVNDYLDEIKRMKRLYGDRIEIYAGMEIDYLDETSNPASPFFQQLPLDYRIGSVHVMRDDYGTYVDIDTRPEVLVERLREHFGNDLERLVRNYFAKLMRMVEAGGFDIVGHADKLYMNAERCQPGITSTPWYKEIIREYFGRIARKGLMVEINTKKFESTGCFSPSIEHFPLLKELNIPVVVDSDAHRPENINSGRDEALRVLKKAGFTHIMELHGGSWQQVPIGA